MTQETPESPPAATPRSLLMNWTSVIGMLLAGFAFVSGATLMLLDALKPMSSPYMGIFLYLVEPSILLVGLLMMLAGALRERKRRRSGRSATRALPVIDLNQRRHLWGISALLLGAALLVTISAVGSYRAYHFSESVTFCGVTCHKVMKPEYTAFQNSPHANVSCTECHIGPGADWFVKAKLNGLRQVWATAMDTYSRPIKAPVHNLRPAKETCYTCHWPQKFFGAVERSRTYFSPDRENSPWTIRMLVKVGGGDPTHGPVEGIHWHMAVANTIEYIATDEKRQEIPWVRVTGADGQVTVYQSSDPEKALSEEQIAQAEIRTMDCIDCHNRPTHRFHSPDFALDMALMTGRLDTELPSIKKHAAQAMLGEYETEEEGLAAIESHLREAYPEGGVAAEQAIGEVQKIYQNNFFPEMKVSWLEYPDAIGHRESPGCARCHDGDHLSDDGRSISKDCNSCHMIIAQGPGLAEEVSKTISGDQPFVHPHELGEDAEGINCYECHTGAPDV